VLLACFPVCSTFLALGLLAFALLIVYERPEAVEVNALPDDDATLRKHPRWWAFALIPVAVGAILGLLAWINAGN
jgi:hypothetical protein